MSGPSRQIQGLQVALKLETFIAHPPQSVSEPISRFGYYYMTISVSSNVETSRAAQFPVQTYREATILLYAPALDPRPLKDYQVDHMFSRAVLHQRLKGNLVGR